MTTWIMPVHQLPEQNGVYHSLQECPQSSASQPEIKTIPAYEPGISPSQKVHIALGKDVKENKKNLLWCLRTFRGAKVIILHVYQPADMVPAPLGGKIHESNVKEEELEAFRQLEWDSMMKSINAYLRICDTEKAEASHLILNSKDDVMKGIVELIFFHEIERLVMGAASDTKYSRKMKVPTSRKAKYVAEYALPSCRIWFVSQGKYVYTREPYSLAAIGSDTPSSAASRSPALNESQEFKISSSPSDSSLQSCIQHGNIESEAFPKTDLHSVSPSLSSIDEIVKASTVKEITNSAQGDTLDAYSAQTEEGDKEDYEEELDELHERLQKAMEEAKSLKKEAYGESERRQKAEQEMIAMKQKARAKEKQRKEAEAALLKQHQETLSALLIDKSSLGKQIEELETKLGETFEKLQSAEKEKREMENQRNEALKRVQEFHSQAAAEARAVPANMVRSFREFSHAELVEVTNNFDPESKIGEGSFGSVVKGRMRYNRIAIKMLNNVENDQGGSLFRQEVEVLSQLRHPNLVTLFGACMEPKALVCEYIPNGSLEEKMRREDGTPSLTWRDRTKIIIEICSALLFLHSRGVVHGHLKPANILLGANLTAKISDSGINRLFAEQNTTVSMSINGMDPKETFAYMDPEFLATGELTPMSDVYSFGVVILQLLTGRPPLWINKIVHKEATAGNLQGIIDPEAGDWPFVQVTKLANIGLKCCQTIRNCRPELEPEVWKVLEKLKGSSSSSSSLSSPSDLVTSKAASSTPPYFICPISQDIMHDPHVAADGFTYEAEALRRWFQSGHETSPMTNLKLGHLDLTPNHALRSAIEDWLMQS